MLKRKFSKIIDKILLLYINKKTIFFKKKVKYY